MKPEQYMHEQKSNKYKECGDSDIYISMAGRRINAKECRRRSMQAHGSDGSRGLRINRNIGADNEHSGVKGRSGMEAATYVKHSRRTNKPKSL
jgi:hypothetical protein